MKRTGVIALPLFVALATQGCLFLPVESSGRDDPFYFSPDDPGHSADFVEVGHYQQNSRLPPSASRHCSVEHPVNKVGSACWFFPVVRVY